MYLRKARSRYLHLTLGILIAGMAAPAYAYIDPVTGSFVIQGLIAGIMAVVAGVRSIRQRILGLFRRRHDNDS